MWCEVLCGLEYVLQLLNEEMWGEESEMRGRTTKESKTKKFELAIQWYLALDDENNDEYHVYAIG